MTYRSSDRVSISNMRPIDRVILVHYRVSIIKPLLYLAPYVDAFSIHDSRYTGLKDLGFIYLGNVKELGLKSYLVEVKGEWLHKSHYISWYNRIVLEH